MNTFSRIIVYGVDIVPAKDNKGIEQEGISAEVKMITGMTLYSS
jgi:hypothetical protein